MWKELTHLEVISLSGFECYFHGFWENLAENDGVCRIMGYNSFP
jgi:hypothetical protein